MTEKVELPDVGQVMQIDAGGRVDEIEKPAVG